jgi:excinuclease ABC subunit A
MSDSIQIKGARLHNLKNISLTIPKNKLVVITGLSGSGKSTLAFDTLHKEGQRQYLESLGMVTDALNKPQVDSIRGLSPSISVDQHFSNRSPRSTVGTVTEVFTYLRVLFARVGWQPCPNCDALVPPLYEPISTDDWDDDAAELAGGATSPCSHCGAAVPEIGMAHFSFNKPAGACPTCTGLGEVHMAALNRLLNEELSLRDDAVLEWDIHYINHYSQTLENAGLY